MSTLIHRKDIRIRDPFIMKHHQSKTYYMYGTNGWDSQSFHTYKSADLEMWEGPYPVFQPGKDFWADRQFWAPEVYHYKDKYMMFASFKSEDECRGTQVLSADHPEGPFQPISSRPVTPRNWECLDGTLFIDEKNQPWMVFCHEWLQVTDGTICAMKLSDDLKEAKSEPHTLFSASEAQWPKRGETYVTDGPYFYRNKQNELLMIWSSFGDEGYAIGIARSASGNILGPWYQEKEPLFSKNGGHGMLFETFGGELMLTFHTPNDSPDERAEFFPVEEVDGLLVLQD